MKVFKDLVSINYSLYGSISCDTNCVSSEYSTVQYALH